MEWITDTPLIAGQPQTSQIRSSKEEGLGHPLARWVRLWLPPSLCSLHLHSNVAPHHPGSGTILHPVFFFMGLPTQMLWHSYFLRQSPEGRGLHPIGPLPHQVKGQPWAMEAPRSILKVAGSERGSPKVGVVGFIISLLVIFFFLLRHSLTLYP